MSSKAIFLYILKQFWIPGTYFIMILDPVAPFSQSMSPWRATAIHFGPETIIFRPPQNANICYRTPKISIIRLCTYCKQRIMYCKYKYLPQRYRLYVSKIQIICLKDANYMSQRYKLCVSKIQIICRKDANSMLQIRNIYIYM